MPAIYRCALDSDWTMEWLSDEIESLTGYPAADFIHNAVRTFASVLHPDVSKVVAAAVKAAVLGTTPEQVPTRRMAEEPEFTITP